MCTYQHGPHRNHLDRRFLVARPLHASLHNLRSQRTLSCVFGRNDHIHFKGFRKRKSNPPVWLLHTLEDNYIARCTGQVRAASPNKPACMPRRKTQHRPERSIIVAEPDFDQQRLRNLWGSGLHPHRQVPDRLDPSTKSALYSIGCYTKAVSDLLRLL